MYLFTFYDWLIENKEVMGDGPGLWCPLWLCLLCGWWRAGFCAENIKNLP